MWRKGARDPKIAVGSRGDRGWSTNSGELGDDPIGSNATKLVHCLLGEPHVTIGACGNVAGERIGCGRPEFSKPASCDLETPDGMISLVGKPDVAIGPGRNADTDAEKGELVLCNDAIGSDRSNLAGRAFAEPNVAVWSGRDECRIAQARGPEVADGPRGVIRATLLLLERVNQKLPSSPMVIAKGWVPPRIGKLLTCVVWAAALPMEKTTAAMPQVSLKLTRRRAATKPATADVTK